MKVTKKQVRELLRYCRSEHPFGWKVLACGFYISNQGELLSYIEYVGQGMNLDLYQGTYTKKIDLMEYINKNEFTLKDATDLATEEIIEMIAESV